MRKFALFAAFLWSLSTLAFGDAVIFNGDYVKTLRDQVNLFDTAYILTGTDDPTSSAKTAPKGSLYLRQTPAGDGALYVKLDTGSSTNWMLLGSGGGSTYTANRAIVSDGSGNLAAATTTATEIGYVNGVTSSIQTQLDGKEPTITTLPVSKGGTGSGTALVNNRIMQSSGGAIVVAPAITASRALVSNASGIPVAATTTSTEIGYVNGVTSAIQTQLNNKVTGPGSATDNAVMRFDGAGGKTAQNSVVTIDDSGVFSGITQLNVDNLRLDGNAFTSTNSNGNIDLTPNGTGVTRFTAGKAARFMNSADTFYTDIKAGSNASNLTLTLPTTAGSNGQFLKTNGSGVLSWDTAGSSVPNSSMRLDNISFFASPGLGIALQFVDASGSALSSGSPAVIAFRSSTSTSGNITTVTATSFSSFFVASGCFGLGSGGSCNNASGDVYVYAMNNGGTLEMMLTATPVDEGELHTTTTFASPGTRDGKYSTNARSNVAVRLVGLFRGNWNSLGSFSSVSWIKAVPWITPNSVTPEMMRDVQATAMGHKKYVYNGSYNGGNSPSLTYQDWNGSSFGSSNSFNSVRQSSFIPYQLQDGTWRLRFSFDVNRSFGSASFIWAIKINGIQFNNLSSQQVNFYPLDAGNPQDFIAEAGSPYSGSWTGLSSNSFLIQVWGGVTDTFSDLTMSGDIELTAKPTWAY